MLADPMYLGQVAAVADTINDLAGTEAFTGVVTYHLTDVSAGGSKRKGLLGSVTHEMTISHSTSGENKPFLTNRTLVRLDQTKLTSDGKSVTMSVYAVAAFPICDAFGVTDQHKALKNLGAFLFQGDVESTGAFKAAGAGNLTVERLLNGEP